MPFLNFPGGELGTPIPANTPHAVSVNLPTWAANIAYEEGDDWVVKAMRTGYPRFFIHKSVQALCRKLETAYGREGETALVFPSHKVAARCRDFIKKFGSEPNAIRIVRLSTPILDNADDVNAKIQAHIAVLFFPHDQFKHAKAYWQHAGEIVSSRMADFCLARLNTTPGRSPALGAQAASPRQGPQGAQTSKGPELPEESRFVEERYGRNLDLSFADEAKVALRRRIGSKVNESAAGALTVSEDDVLLFPTGMNSIFFAHRLLLAARGTEYKSVCFGFPYVDTRNILSKFGPGVHFYGNGEEEDLDELEKRLEGGEKILGLFCEFPSNPLLKSANMKRIRALADKYDFAVIVDETVGNVLNVNLLPYSDIVVSSLTKVFSGDSNVMGGSAVVNPKSRYYDLLKETIKTEFEDLFWAEDAIYLERNSRDVAQRNEVINSNTEAVADFFAACPLVQDTFYPKYTPTKRFYDDYRVPGGGYGCLVSVVFKNPSHAIAFFDAINTAKGPSLGTNFTLTCPYTILAHYGELDYVSQFGVDRNLVRISVGLEEQQALLDVFRRGLDSIKDESNGN